MITPALGEKGKQDFERLLKGRKEELGGTTSGEGQTEKTTAEEIGISPVCSFNKMGEGSCRGTIRRGGVQEQKV